jgi:hypothetical protein
MSPTVFVTDNFGQPIRHKIMLSTTGISVIVTDAPQHFTLTAYGSTIPDSPVGDALQPVRHGPVKKGRGGKVKRW